jgi:CO/xanthine dehydrogenase Mo-binding subunit
MTNRVQVMSGALAMAAIAASAIAQEPRAGMQITVQMTFKRNGELFGQPRITFESPGASDDERLAYRIAVAEMLKRCTPLPFTEALGNAVAGRPFTMRFIDSRKLKQAGNIP